MENKDIESMIEQSMLDAELMMMDQYQDYDDNGHVLEQSSSTFHDSGVGVGNSRFQNSSYSINNSTDFSFNDQINRSSINNISNLTANVTSTSSKDIFYCANYFDLDDILSQTIRISVKFQRTVPKLGFLDPSFNQMVADADQNQQQQNDIAKGTKLELPLWIVKELNGDNVVTITVPKSYNIIQREILEADANCVDLHKLGPNFYQTGKHLTAMNLSESEDIAITLLDTFTQRFPRLVNFALSIGGECKTSSKSNDDNHCSSSQSTISQIDSIIKTNTQNKFLKEIKGGQSVNDVSKYDLNQFILHLDNWENNLMDVGQRISQQIRRWQNRDLVKVHPNELVVNLKKRKILFEQQKKEQQQRQTVLQQKLYNGTLDTQNNNNVE